MFYNKILSLHIFQRIQLIENTKSSFTIRYHLFIYFKELNVRINYHIFYTIKGNETAILGCRFFLFFLVLIDSYGPLKPLNMLECCDVRGFHREGVLNWSPMMPRGASPSDSCTSDLIFFFNLVGRKCFPVARKILAVEKHRKYFDASSGFFSSLQFLEQCSGL